MMSGSAYIASHAEELLASIRSLDNKFRKSCDQILLLNNQIEDLHIRYDRAMGANRRSFRYSIRLRLASLEGVRNMFYEYASRSAVKLEELQNELILAGGILSSDITGQEWEPVSSSEEDDEELEEDLEEEEDITTATTTTISSSSNVIIDNNYSNDNSDNDEGDLESTADMDSNDSAINPAVITSSKSEEKIDEEL